MSQTSMWGTGSNPTRRELLWAAPIAAGLFAAPQQDGTDPGRAAATDPSLLTKSEADARYVTQAALSEGYAHVFAAPAPKADPTGVIDLLAIQNSIDRCAAAGGGTVQLQPGTYLLNSHISIRSGVHLAGAGRDQTLLKLRDGGGGNSVIQNASWTASTNSWATAETDYSITDLTCDANSPRINGFRYGIALMRVARVTIERVRVRNTRTGSGIFVNNGYDVEIRHNQLIDIGGNGVFVTDVVRFDVTGNDIPACGDFGIEIGSGYDYGRPGGTQYCGDGTVIGNRVAHAANFGIALRGYRNAAANPNRHHVQQVSVAANVIRDCPAGEFVAFEFVRGTTFDGSNNVRRAGEQVYATKRYSSVIAASDFTSGATGVIQDISGLSVSFTPLVNVIARVYLRVRASSSAGGLNAVYATIAPPPLQGQAQRSAVQTGAAGDDLEYVVVDEVVLAGRTSHTIRAQFFQSRPGTFIVQQSPNNTELLVVTTPLT